MKTEETKLKTSFTKEMPVNSGTSTNCTVKVPILIDNNPKPVHKRSVCQAKVPKHSTCTASCTNIKNSWVIWSAVAFSAVVVIVIFASLQGKTSAELKRAKNKITNLESMADALRKDIADLERRWEDCYMSVERFSLIVISVRDFANLLTPVGIVKLFLNYT